MIPQENLKAKLKNSCRFMMGMMRIRQFYWLLAHQINRILLFQVVILYTLNTIAWAGSVLSIFGGSKCKQPQDLKRFKQTLQVRNPLKSLIKK